jgi:branched-chain amino acid aminotransferase
MPWLNGVTYETSKVPFDLADRGLLLADGVFDTALALGGRLVWRRDHIARLVAFGAALGFVLESGAIEEAIDAVLPQTAASVRVTVTRGVGPRGLAPPREAKPTIFATTAPLRAEALFAPISLMHTPIRRNETSPTARLKSLAYLDAVLAMRQALASGFDDCLFLNTKGAVACTAVGNLFAVVGEEIVTPPIDEGVVPGLLRAVILKHAETLGFAPIERALQLGECESADAVFVTNSLRLLTPVSLIGKTRIESSHSRRVQALIALIATLVRDETGIDPRTLR